MLTQGCSAGKPQQGTGCLILYFTAQMLRSLGALLGAQGQPSAPSPLAVRLAVAMLALLSTINSQSGGQQSDTEGGYVC